VHYFLGNDPTQWRTDLPTYAQVFYRDVYPGIDLVYYGNQGQLEYDFIVAPGVDPAVIHLAFEGPEAVDVDGEGHLVLHTASGALRLHKPVVYQDIDGVRQPVAGHYVLQAFAAVQGGDKTSAPQVGIQVAAYDVTRPLVIDPVLSYSTYLGGGGPEVDTSLAVDASGNVYVTGETGSVDFPTTPGAFQTTSGGGTDVFVSKLNAAGTALLYSSYLGGGGLDESKGIAVDTSGNAYVLGETLSSNFPTTPGAFQTTAGGSRDAFVTKLSATGAALVYSTYLGGSGSEGGGDIAVDGSGNAYVTGSTASSNFPTTPGAFQLTSGGGLSDAFVTRFNAAGTALLGSTYLGGGGADIGKDIALDPMGSVYVTGETTGGFPTTPGAFQTTFGGAVDAFVTKMSPSGSTLSYSTYLGGSSAEVSGGLAVDTSGSAYIVGETSSVNFPTTPGAFQLARSGAVDAFVAKVDPTGAALVYATYLGGSLSDQGFDIAVDAVNNAYVIGLTGSANFPTTPGAFQTIAGCFSDAFVTQINATGTALIYSTYLGGVGNDRGQSIAVDASGNIYTAGSTDSANFPITSGAFQATLGGSLGALDAFITKFSPGPAGLVCDMRMSKASYVNGETATAAILRLANLGTTPLPVELKLWLEVPGLAPVPFANVGADGSVVLAPGFDTDFGPLALFLVTTGLPRGPYAFSCRFLSPVTGRLLSEDFNPFVLLP
jgi:hypothetical protein